MPTVMEYSAKVKHDGVIHELQLPATEVPCCKTCGNWVYTTAMDERVNEVLRAKLHLLAPEQIRANIAKLGLNQQELADWLDVAPETVSRWMTGALIQSSRMNKRLRMFFAFPAARDMLRQLDEEPQLGMVACSDGEEDKVSHAEDNDAEQGLVGVPDKSSDPVNRIKSRYSFHLPPGELAEARARAALFGSLASPCPSPESPMPPRRKLIRRVLPTEQLATV